MKKNVFILVTMFMVGLGSAIGSIDKLSVKLRLAYLDPADKSDAFSALGIDFAADSILVESKWIPEIDIEYAFTENLLGEVVLTIPQRHEVTLAGVGSVGELEHLPPRSA